jgi:hypothetical protein
MRKLDRFDVLTVVGLGMVSAGLWWVYPPVALIVCGALLMAAGMRGGAPRGER